MREIKFRYWSQYECEMYTKAYMEERLHLAFMSELLEAAQKRYILMQYTGLKDKNEREIYEGDILNVIENRSTTVIDYSSFHCSTNTWTSKTKHVVEFTPSNLQLTDYYVRLHDCEVIGNIYEHPNLLETGRDK